MKVLLVESPGTSLAHHVRGLRECGMQAEAAADPHAALWLLAGGGYRVVVLDLGRGALQWDVVAAALWNRPPARVVALAEGPLDPALRRRAYGAGVWELVELPEKGLPGFHPSLMAGVVGRALEGGAPPAVLMVDDCPGVAEGIGAMIAEAGHSVEVAATAAEALRLMRSHRYALIVTETRRIGQDGFQVMREAPRLQPGVPVIALAAALDDATFLRAIELGAKACLWKLAEPEEIACAIQAALREAHPRGPTRMQEET